MVRDLLQAGAPVENPVHRLQLFLRRLRHRPRPTLPNAVSQAVRARPYVPRHDRDRGAAAELKALGLHRRTRLVSGPQGPHVLLDGKPVLLLCSNNYLGLADHPQVREAAAEAAMRWGVGAGASRLVSGTMTIHRRLEERLADFKRREAALLFGSGYLANVGAIAALARPGDVVFSDELNHASIIDGCRLSRAEVFVYDHCDVEHLAWGIAQAEGRGALIVTDSVFSMDGDVAPLAEIVELAQRHRLRVLVDEAHGTGALGPGGRGAVAEAGLEDQVDVIVGTLGKALGAYGAFVACDRSMAPVPRSTPPARSSSRPRRRRPRSPARWRRSSCSTSARVASTSSQSNAAALRDELAREGFDVRGSRTQIVPLVVGDAELAMRICEAALARGVFAQAIRPPTVPAGTSRLRLAVMASHREEELRDAARTARRRRARRRFRAAPGVSPAADEPAAAAVFDAEAPQTVGRKPRSSAPCAAASSPGRTPGSARRVARRRDRRRRCARGASTSARSSRSSPGSMSRPIADWPHDHELLAAVAGCAARRGRLRRLRPAGLAAPRARAGRRASSTPGTSCVGGQRARSEARDARGRGGRRRPARSARARLRRARAGRATSGCRW